MSNSFRDHPLGHKGVVASASRAGAGENQEYEQDRSAPSTQIARDRDDYLGETATDIGRQTRANEYELFVSCNPAPAMQQQFEHLHPEFIAVHDVGTTSSRKLLSSLAVAGGRPMQKLVIRRQGYGTALATIHFVELPSAAGTRLRMYSTDCETEPAWRQSLAHMLLAFSRLGVVMVGDLKPADIGESLGRLRDSMLRGPWQNVQMLLLPLGSASGLVNHGMELARGTEVNVRTTPQVTRATDAWGFISGTWNRLTSGQAVGQGSNPRPPDAHFQPMPVAPVKQMEAATPQRAPAAFAPPAAAQDRAFAPTQQAIIAAPSQQVERPPAAASQALHGRPTTIDLLRRYVRQINELAGVIGCTVFDAATGQRVVYAGTGPSAANLAAQGAELMSAILKAGAALDLGRALPEAAITLDSHHLVLRPVPRHPGLALHAVLDMSKANLTLVRLQILRMDTLFEELG